jgi:hypothetical protein
MPEPMELGQARRCDPVRKPKVEIEIAARKRSCLGCSGRSWAKAVIASTSPANPNICAFRKSDPSIRMPDPVASSSPWVVLPGGPCAALTVFFVLFPDFGCDFASVFFFAAHRSAFFRQPLSYEQQRNGAYSLRVRLRLGRRQRSLLRLDSSVVFPGA